MEHVPCECAAGLAIAFQPQRVGRERRDLSLDCSLSKTLGSEPAQTFVYGQTRRLSAEHCVSRVIFPLHDPH